MTAQPATSDHRPEPWFHEAGSDHCPHGPESDRHTGSPQDVRICLDAPMGDRCPECSEDHGAPVPWVDCPENPAVVPYCTGDRCADCTADEECCEASCGCCPRVDAQGWCWIGAETQEGSRCCSQHGERWLNDRTPEAERRYQILRGA